MKEADKAIQAIEQSIIDIKSDAAKKLLIVRNEQAYTSKLAGDLSEIIEGGFYKPSISSSKVVFSADKHLYGEYDIYGNTLHGKFIRRPRNVLNIETSTGPLFRNNAIAYVNEKESEDFKQALMMNGAKGKGVYFEEHDTPEVTLKIEIDRSKILGDTHFNILEINPFLENSFTFESVTVWEIDKQTEIAAQFVPMHEIGKSRIVLDRKYELYVLEIKVKLQYQNQAGKYPFGLQSLQLLDGDFKEDSYVVMKVEKSDYIEYIGNRLTVREHTGDQETTIQDEKIKVYIDFEDGVLSGEVGVSTDDILQPIARNTRSLYLYMPIKRALRSLVIKKLETR